MGQAWLLQVAESNDGLASAVFFWSTLLPSAVRSKRCCVISVLWDAREAWFASQLSTLRHCFQGKCDAFFITFDFFSFFFLMIFGASMTNICLSSRAGAWVAGSFTPR